MSPPQVGAAAGSGPMFCLMCLSKDLCCTPAGQRHRSEQRSRAARDTDRGAWGHCQGEGQGGPLACQRAPRRQLVRHLEPFQQPAHRSVSQQQHPRCPLLAHAYSKGPLSIESEELNVMGATPYKRLIAGAAAILQHKLYRLTWNCHERRTQGNAKSGRVRVELS